MYFFLPLLFLFADMLNALSYKGKDMAGFLGYTLSVVSSYFHLSTRLEKQRISSDFEPYIRHKSLHTWDFYGKDLLIIGDVHGCHTELLQLLSRASEYSKKPFLKVFVGDMINKGPRSEDVLQYLTTAKDVYCVRGNHEQKVLQEYFSLQESEKGVPEDRLWVKNLKRSYVDYIKNLPYTIRIPFLNIVVVHAGFIPGIPIDLQDTNSMLNMRNLFWTNDDFHGKKLEFTYRTNIGTAWCSLWPGPEHVYFGHDAIRKLQFSTHSTGLDTGCVYGGELTAILLHLDDQYQIVDKRMIHVKPEKVYVPVSD